MTSDKASTKANLKSMLDMLGIDKDVQAILESKHQVVDYKTLKAKQYHLDRKQLEGIDKDVQSIVGSALFYADILQKTHGYKDPLARFTKKGWVDYAATTGIHSSAIDLPDSDNDDEPTPLRKITLESELVEASTNGNAPSNNNGSGDSMEVDEMDEDDLFKVSRQRPARKKVAKPSNEDDADEDDEEDVHQKEQLTFGMMPQGFQPSDGLLVSIGEFGNPNKKESIVLESVIDIQGRCFVKGKCYHYTPDDGNSIVIGIKYFKSKKTALCVQLKPISETYLGINDDDGSFSEAVSAHYEGLYAQVTPMLPVPVASLGDESTEPSDLPKLMYEPQKPHSQMELAYVRDNDGSNIVRVPREDIRLIEGFSGAGGMHIGYEEEGFTTVRAVEYDKQAVETFEHNNPGVPVFCGDIRKFLDMIETDEGKRKELGRIDVIHTSSPCQGFSLLNPGGKDDDERNGLSFTFPRLLKLTGALVGVFENVVGMWSKGSDYLKKILIDCIGMGYQVRVKVLKSKDYGDPQCRPRLIIIAAKNFVQMPDHPAPTHGKARHLKPYVTCGDVLDYLSTPEGRKLPNMETQRLGDKKVEEKLFKHNLAPAMLASGKALQHYAEPRFISVREAAALQSFPYDYEFLGTTSAQFRQLGNAVPIELSRNIARSVREKLRHRYVEEFAPADGLISPGDVDKDEQIEMDHEEIPEEGAGLSDEVVVDKDSQAKDDEKDAHMVHAEP